MSAGAGVLVAGYAVLAAAAVVLAWVGRRRPDRVAPAGELLDVLLASRAARVLLVVFWWWLGWHFLVGPTLDTRITS
ncbi:hypothetical protein Bcav_0932 [Beutenbergia cavernae DSM 12333]|uniref:Uncharacterized protein n=1 Tax=Beutenbergia cavernae (strain ATCC BAA-8 / DSM 12333 / CCUG 43141 / JCM 11478 / NBRC 16432 / NCIMB 13614 / HKI 0122) TaxID=471853 RepID=C5BZM1_BEUC1|nr:DUF6186 family protein [Beutenbergia cavernae]ACQ79193.1 hypothetical protein Bcav_0932 [Beutenbergia cavernae DSM 12333]